MPKWIRASCSADSNSENCVEAALIEGGSNGGMVVVRSTTNPLSTVSFTVAEWSAFLANVRDGTEFDF